ncbi:MAG TPA: AmmeMemoRadiSam system protein B [Alphaproteobacteria bacterium]|nr:AmmeMemoRadiSam system protein B [Alphaproteobacteria bacterium]
MTENARPAAVAGFFYPDDPTELARVVGDYLGTHAETSPAPKAIIAPHAGYIYSGPVAASVYARLRSAKGRVRRVVLIGPAHRVALRGLAAPRATSFATPLGELPVDREALEQILALPQVSLSDEAHRLEHSLEVQLPFLMATLGPVAIVPLVVGDARGTEVAEVIEALWDSDETLVAISSDLSHYHDYQTARRMDAATSAAIEALDEERIGWDQACGQVAIAGLLQVARKRGLTARTLDLRNSGDTAGPRNEVVGYGAYAFD